MNGQAVGSNDFRLNGLSDMAAFFNANAIIQPPPDAIEEFKISTGDYNAEIGHGIGGVVNAVVKSGTNQLHGDLWDYFRNNAMDAKDYFTAQNSATLPELRQNQFGGTVGGPGLHSSCLRWPKQDVLLFRPAGTQVDHAGPGHRPMSHESDAEQRLHQPAGHA